MSGLELRQKRLRLGWTQVRLAKEIGKHVNTVRNWELGRSPIQRAEALALKAIIRAERERQGFFGRSRRSS